MKRRSLAILRIAFVAPAVASAAELTDPVRVLGESQVKDQLVFEIAPPAGRTEVSWPKCPRVTISVPRTPQHASVSLQQHAVALNQLRNAVRTKQPIHLGPGEKGFIAASDDRCRLDSKALTYVQRPDGSLAVRSFDRD